MDGTRLPDENMLTRLRYEAGDHLSMMRFYYPMDHKELTINAYKGDFFCSRISPRNPPKSADFVNQRLLFREIDVHHIKEPGSFRGFRSEQIETYWSDARMDEDLETIPTPTLELLYKNFFLYKNWGINIICAFLCKKPLLMQKVTFYVKGVVFVQKPSFYTKRVFVQKLLSHNSGPLKS
jgi:hypothetical protein